MHGTSSLRAARALVVLGLVAAATLAADAAPPGHASASRPRCGWLVNDTPGNFELIDRQGRWTIAEQGGYQASGFDDMPDMSTRGWVETNGPHGHGCACMSAVVDTARGRIVRLSDARPVPLARCTRDAKLPKF